MAEKKNAKAVSTADKKKAIDAAMEQIEKMYGKGSIMRYGDGMEVNVETIPTGSLSLDLALQMHHICLHTMCASCLKKQSFQRDFLKTQRNMQKLLTIEK